MAKKTNKTIRIRAEFDVPEETWKSLPWNLQANGMCAEAGVSELSPADLVAFLVMKYGKEVK